MAEKGKIIDEHFWFTATTMALNGFIISSAKVKPYITTAKVLSLIVTLYAIFLIVHRAASYAGKLEECYPDKLKELSEDDKTYLKKTWETWCHLKAFPRFLLYVTCEFGSALFFLILVVSSCVAVWIIT